MKPFNGLTPAQAELIALLAEECSEVILECMKVLRHGFNSCHPQSFANNQENLEKEIGHVINSYRLLIGSGVLNSDNIHNSLVWKSLKVFSYLHHNTRASTGVEPKQTYEQLLQAHGICTDCGELYEHDYETPIANCGCHCSEWHELTPHMKIVKSLKERNHD